MKTVFAIETSCDETGLAVVEDGTRMLVNDVASQIPLHAEFGGVVPEIASRQHTEIISQMADRALQQAGTAIDAVAVTHGPGLMGSLLVGVNFAKAFAYAKDLPIVPVNHIEGHIFSPFLCGAPPEFPALALIVSGGHTMLIMCRAPHDYELLGTTRDDAVGESFDKVARLLDLPYPGGPSIQRAAEKGDPQAFRFPRAFEKSDKLEFSYSGLKTAVLYALRDKPDAVHADVAASFQAAAIDILIIKTKLALARTRAPRLIVAGGVAANTLLRQRLNAEIEVPALIPPIGLCTDNAAMIAAAGYSRFHHGFRGDLRLTPNPGLVLV
ncbi:MAG: tRNA (adenosine(37)-N6)-threonylcarbamoyltransferase complex transferase subunit TsaD [Candidatus Hydrogenedentes bacterium]|nr:tRNA (adenosine(37)-N6)-threonylcarbamoyltransferase complex transferase subunit TsaD [Candidatus Hydrogenedentota bacterium]